MITNTTGQVPAHRPSPRPRPPASRTVRPATAWDDVDRTLLGKLAEGGRKSPALAGATGYPPSLVKDQLIGYVARGLVVKDGQTSQYLLTDAGRNRLAQLTAYQG